MPYISQEDREYIKDDLYSDGINFTPCNAGELNYVTSTFINNYLAENGLNYANLNEMIGALECTKMELNRVLIGPYEDVKIKENGHAYDVSLVNKAQGY